MMEIVKRSGQAEAYDRNKITSAVRKAFVSTDTEVSEATLEAITTAVEARIPFLLPPVSVEQIQDLVEETLMLKGYFAQSKAYILYRSGAHEKARPAKEHLLVFRRWRRAGCRARQGTKGLSAGAV